MKKTFTTAFIFISVFLFKTNVVTAQVNTSDSIALVDLYNSTDGPHWKHHENWLTNAPVSTWYGITVSNTNVTIVALSANKHSGSIPASIGNFTNLNYLYLDNNQITNGIPSSIGNLTSLINLSLFADHLTGNIPPELGNLVNLTKLGLSFNQLNGNIPVSFGNLVNLTTLTLNNNKLTGNIPAELGNLVNLTGLFINFNRLKGAIPNCFGNLTKVVTLYMDNNQLTGAIPFSFGNLTSLYDLQLQNNKLSGKIPSLSNLSALSFLQLENNNFTFAGMGNIEHDFPFAVYSPQANIILNENNNVLSAYAGGNQALINNTYYWYKNGNFVIAITGDSTFQPSQSGLYSVKVANATAKQLSLYSDTNNVIVHANASDSLALVDLYNSTHGPEWYSHENWLTSAPLSTWHNVFMSGNRVTTLILKQNNLKGKLPASLGNLTKLTTLDLSYNNLKGNVPAALSTLTNINNLLLNNNKLDGNIPAFLGNLTSLTYLGLGNNRLTGNIPVELGNLSNLISLNLSGNQLTGGIPVELGNLSSVQYFNLNANQLSGNLPDALGNLNSVNGLYLAANQFTGNIPSSLGNLTHLYDLYLSSNQLTGTIPSSFANLKELQSLVLSANQLSGSLPSFLGKLPILYLIDINQNQFSDTIPASLSKQFDLTINLSYNRFTFAGLGRLVSAFKHVTYSPQASIPLHINGNIFSVSAGSVLKNNTYKLYKDGILYQTKVGDSTFTITENGTYYIRVGNSVATKLKLYSDTITYNAADNIIASKINNKISSASVYPNPAKTAATVSFNADGKYTITVADMSGKILQTKTGVAVKGVNTIQLDVSKYAGGMYLITVTNSNNKRQTIRLNKE